MKKTLNKHFFRLAATALLGLFIVSCGAKQEAAPNMQEAEGHYKMGVAFLNSENDYRAYQELKKAYDINPDNPDYAYSISLFYLKKQRYAKAKQFVEEALALRPGHSEYLNTYAAVLANLGRIDEAISTWQKVVNDPSYAYHIMSYFNMANTLFDAGRYNEVPYYANKALEINRMFTDAYFLLYRTYLRQDDYKEAEAVLRRAVEYVPVSVPLRFELAKFYYDRGQFEKALPLFASIIDNSPDTEQAARAEMMLKKLGLIHE